MRVLKTNLTVEIGNTIYSGCRLLLDHYHSNNRIALLLDVPSESLGLPPHSLYFEPLAICTVNLPDVPLDDDEVLIKDYSKNEGVAQSLINNNILLEPSTFTTTSGYVTVDAYKLDPEILNLIEAVENA